MLASTRESLRAPLLRDFVLTSRVFPNLLRFVGDTLRCRSRMGVSCGA